MNSSMEDNYSTLPGNPRRAALVLSLFGAMVVPSMMTSCGKKEDPKPAPAPAASAPAPDPAPVTPPPVATPTPKATTPATPAATPTPAPTPPPTTATPTPPPATAATTRDPAAAAAWQRWDNAAAGLRDIGLTVRPSNDPAHLEIVAPGGRMSPMEARLIVKNVQGKFGRAPVFIALYNESGVPLAEATSGGVQ